MKFSEIIIAIAAVCSSLTAFAQEHTRYELDVKDFSELKVTDAVNVDYVCNPDSAGKAVFFAKPDVASRILFVPSNNKLEIQLSPAENNYPAELPKVTVYSSYLTFAENSGDSTLRVMSVAPGPKFRARVIGNGRIVVRNVKATQVDASLDTGKGSVVVYGEATTAKLSCTGTGTIQADELKAVNIKCSLWGTGSIGCAPSETLSVMGAGSGTVYYRGKPSIKNRSLGVKLSPLDN